MKKYFLAVSILKLRDEYQVTQNSCALLRKNLYLHVLRLTWLNEIIVKLNELHNFHTILRNFVYTCYSVR